LKKPSSFHLLHNSTQHRKGQSVWKLEVTEYLLQQSTMHLPTLSFIILFCHTSLAFPQYPYPNQALKLPEHPSNWMCTVHITTPSFSNYTSSDVIERIMTTNHEKIIPTLSTTHNRSFIIAPVNSFFEPCTISILVDTTVNGSSYIFRDYWISIYIHANKYVYRGWRNSIIIVIHFSCFYQYAHSSLKLPHRLFYHSLECGPQRIFPTGVFVPNFLRKRKLIIFEDQRYNIHDRNLPCDIRRLISRSIYIWNMHNPNEKSKYCLYTRWNELPLEPCLVEEFAVEHFQHFLNFTVVKVTEDNLKRLGAIITNGKDVYDPPSIFLHAIGSRSERIIYCDQNWDTTRLRPINISSPFSSGTWAMLALLIIISAVASSFAIFELSSITNHLTVVTFIKKILNSLADLVVVLLEKDLGKRNSIKIFVGLIVIYLGNEYKNRLTIELVFPRAEDAIRNITELLDLNFNIIYKYNSAPEGVNKSIFLKSMNTYWEIDADKREKYLREVDRWLMFNVFIDNEDILDKITKVTEKNAFLLSVPDHLQVNTLQAFRVSSYPISCHFVKQPFAPQFYNLYFINPKVEEFKWLTAKFLDHGLFEFWKRLHSHLFNLGVRRHEKFNKRFNNSSSTESPDLSNFIGQVHISVFYILVSILAVTCILVFLFECAIQNAQELSLFAFQKIQLFGINLLWLFIGGLFLVGRLISRVHQTRKSLQKHTKIIIVQVRSVDPHSQA
jgi:hypothetical protein